MTVDIGLDRAGTRPMVDPLRHKRENFPVASLLIARRYRPTVIAFYRFARQADDVADDPALPPAEKLNRIAAMRRTIFTGEAGPETAMRVARLLRERGLDIGHASDLLAAFAQDVEVSRYETWDDLIAYCRLSAMPVGRFMLDLHGESRGLWPLGDALCAALQIINHLQDCGEDFRKLDRVYLPTAWLADAGAAVTDLGGVRASPGLSRVLSELARRSQDLLIEARPLSAQVADRRLGRELAVIHAVAERLAVRLQREDPLASRVALTRMEAARASTFALLRYRQARA